MGARFKNGSIQKIGKPPEFLYREVTCSELFSRKSNVAAVGTETEKTKRLVRRLSSSSGTEKPLEYRGPGSTTGTTRKGPRDDCQSLGPSENYPSTNMSVSVGQVCLFLCEQELKQWTKLELPSPDQISHLYGSDTTSPCATGHTHECDSVKKARAADALTQQTNGQTRNTGTNAALTSGLDHFDDIAHVLVQDDQIALSDVNAFISH